MGARLSGLALALCLRESPRHSTPTERQDMNTETKTPESVGSLAWASDSAPTYCEGIESLYSWSSNYQDMKPFRKFLDLIGYSAEQFGVALSDWADPSDSFGYMELAKLSKALTDWANRPQDCEAFILKLLSVESEFGL